MRACPKCGQSFNDDNLSFCLLDGERLVAGDSEPTVVMPPTIPQTSINKLPGKKRKTLLWVSGAILVLGIGAAVLVVVALIAYRIGNARAGSNGVAATNTSSTTASKTASTPAAALTPTPLASPTTSDTGDDQNDEITPIAWNTSAAVFKTDAGLTYRFECPPGGTIMALWGSDVYTADSSICTAAVHAGKITLDSGGQVTIEMRPGRAIYGSTTRNGVTSNTFGEYAHSFVVR